MGPAQRSLAPITLSLHMITCMRGGRKTMNLRNTERQFRILEKKALQPRKSRVADTEMCFLALK